MKTLRSLAGVCLALLLCLGGSAHADSSSDARALLMRGIALHREASYAASVAVLEQARQKGLDGSEKAEATFYIAANYVALSSVPAARRELRALLDTNPAYELPAYTSPKVVALFREVKDEIERAPRLKPLTPRRIERRVELVFEPTQKMADSWGAAFWRWKGDSSFREVPFTRSGDLLVSTVELSRAGTMEYYASMRTSVGLTSSGSPQKPFELTVPELPPEPPAVKPTTKKLHWGVWAGIGAAVVAVGVGTGLGVYYGTRPSTNPTTEVQFDFVLK